ncbi:MAG: class I SAM-dependent methyltransferase [Acidobacteriaceae bacterium]
MSSAPSISATREHWNQRYRAGEHTSTDPDPILLQFYDEFIAPTFPHGGRGLDMAGGAGRHAIWMAQQPGWQMTLSDLSDTATALARQNAAAVGAAIQIVNEPAIDTLTRAASENARYDLLMIFQFLDRSLFPAIRAAVRPGGLIVYKTYALDHLQLGDGSGPKDAARLLERQELLHRFSDFRVLFYHETIVRRGTQAIVVQVP